MRLPPALISRSVPWWRCERLAPSLAAPLAPNSCAFFLCDRFLSRRACSLRRASLSCLSPFSFLSPPASAVLPAGAGMGMRPALPAVPAEDTTRTPSLAATERTMREIVSFSSWHGRNSRESLRLSGVLRGRSLFAAISHARPASALCAKWPKR